MCCMTCAAVVLSNLHSWHITAIVLCSNGMVKS
jgi:hypothetical protein